MTVDVRLHHRGRCRSADVYEHDVATTGLCGLEDDAKGLGGGDGRSEGDEDEDLKQ
jgi:hypothetical protein